MKTLTTLIKLHQRKLDDLRRKMGALVSQRTQLEELSTKLQQELLREMEMAGKQPEMGSFFGGFARRIQTRQEGIATEMRSLDEQMAALREEIAMEFGELKKFEIARENARKRAEAEASRKETIALDEIAGQQHRRRQEYNE